MSLIQILVWAKIETLTGPIRKTPPPIHLHESFILQIVRSHHGTLGECRTRDPEVPILVQAKRKTLTGPIRTILPPIPLHQS